MKNWATTLIAATFLFAAYPEDASAAIDARSKQSIWVGGFGAISDWRAVGRDELVIWASPKRPYLVKIWRPSRNLKFVHTIGVTMTNGRITTFDSILADGQRLPIKSIMALDNKSVRELQKGK